MGQDAGTEQITAGINAEVTRAWQFVRGHVRTYLSALLAGALVTAGVIIRSHPNLLVALVSSAFSLCALLLALVCLKLRRQAQEQASAAQDEIERLKRQNLIGLRSYRMLEESLGHVLLAWSGSVNSVQALERTMPRNIVVKGAVRELQRSGYMTATVLNGVRSLVRHANEALLKVEAEIGPDRVDQRIMLTVTSRGTRAVDFGEDVNRDLNEFDKGPVARMRARREQAQAGVDGDQSSVSSPSEA